MSKLKNEYKPKVDSDTDQEVLDELDKFIEKRKIQNDALKKIANMKTITPDNDKKTNKK